jgi:ubiquinone/menaquinone biosynthesis C-methylase UbiE
MNKYVHGYSEREAIRLSDQANTLTDILHHDSIWKPCEIILEAGCGVGAQTKIIASQNTGSQFVSIDISDDSVSKASDLIETMGLNNVKFLQADIFNLPFPDNYFDHVFVCFVHEHLSDYNRALIELKRVLKPSGSITLIEGDHGSAYFYPDSKEANLAIQCQVELQKRHGGNANIGRQLFPILVEAGFFNIHVSPRMVYADDSRPEMVEGFTKNTFTAMIEGVRSEVLTHNLLDQSTFDKGIKDLYKTAGSKGVFCYTFFKAKAYKN